MKRRSFFGILFGGLLARFLPKPKVLPTRVDVLDMSKWGPELESGLRWHAEGNLPTYGHQYTVAFVTKSGYTTAPSPWPGKWSAVKQLPIGPPNVVSRILKFDS